VLAQPRQPVHRPLPDRSRCPRQRDHAGARRAAHLDADDHGWYDHDADPHELFNRANDPARATELRDHYERLQAHETESFVTFG
jgi:hypothetical protein